MSVVNFLGTSVLVVLDMDGALPTAVMGGGRICTAAAAPGREEDVIMGATLLSTMLEGGRVTEVGLVDRAVMAIF